MAYSGFYYDGLDYSTLEINLNFKIKVSGIDNDGRKHNKLVGVDGLITIVKDTDLVNKMINKAFSKGIDKVECRLRRGLKITFYTI